MIIRELNQEADVPQIIKWLPDADRQDVFAKNTFIAEKDDEIIAIGSIRLMEGPVCCLDSLATNPSFDSIIRHNALDMLVFYLLNHAKHLKFKQIFAYTLEDSIVHRAEKHGFIVTNQKLIIKELN